MTAKPDPATVPLDSPKGTERAGRLQARIDYLLGPSVVGYVAKAEASALKWVLARLRRLEDERLQQRISQARAAEIIQAWRDAGETTDLDGRVVLDRLDLDRLRIG